MRMIKRLSATVVSRVDRAIRGMENHDAVVGVSVRDLQRALAEARVRHQRAQTEGSRQAQKREELRREAEKWRERARAAGDEDTALECLRRGRFCDRQAEQVAAGEEQQRQAEQRLGQAVERLERRLSELQGQRQVLRSREAAARAGAAAHETEGVGEDDLAEILERWEVDVTEAELSAAEPVDELAERFDAEEERASLRAELASIRRPSGEG